MSDLWYSDALTQVTGILSKVPLPYSSCWWAAWLSGWPNRHRPGSTVTRLDPTLGSLLQSVVTFAGWVLVLTAATASLGLQQVSLALGGSIALVAMSLSSSVSSVAQDLLAGVFLIGDRDFRVGYMVRTGAVEGIVESVGIRKTKIRDGDGTLHTVPNRLIDNATYVTVNTEMTQPEDEESSQTA